MVPTTYRLTSLNFIPCLGYGYFKIWPWNSKAKVIARGHIVRSTFYQLTPFVPCQPALQFLRCSYLKIWPWKSKFKVMGEVTSLDFVPCQSATRFSGYGYLKIWPWKSKVLASKGHIVGTTSPGQHPIDPHSYRTMSIDASIPDIQLFQNLTLKIQGQYDRWEGVAAPLSISE